MKISYYQTELPTILLAINFIVFQISLIMLITKDQILGIFPENNAIAEWVKEQVDYYFYLILCFVITIIVMSNPYVGFGRLVLYLLTSLILTLLLSKALLVLHGGVKNIARHAFFTADEEMMRERFDHARTWFGLLIIVSFFFFSFLGFVVGATIWGWQITFKDVLALLYKPLLLETTTYPLTILSLLQIIGFVMLGFFAAYAINHFVLDRIFDLLLVDPGVQYTTTRFIQYSVVIIFVFFGFKNVGLGELVGYILGALALGVGWYVREPIGDLMAYFIILVQRPLKIGDFIQIDAEVFGVVRKITPRAVVIRRRNSTTIVVPNSHIINRAIVNWNYVRTFIAFNDIMLIVAFKEDPTIVKDLLLKAVNQHPNVLRNPKALVRLEEFGEFGYVFLVRGFISSAYTLDMWDIASDVRIIIARILNENNIEIVEVMRILKEGTNRLTMISPQQRESTDKKITE
jgi:small-conductance mechanosensitive channel